MPTIEVLTERADPVSPTTSAADIFARFQREPDTLVIPVVENDRPVGLEAADTCAVHECPGIGFAVAVFVVLEPAQTSRLR